MISPFYLVKRPKSTPDLESKIGLKLALKMNENWPF